MDNEISRLNIDEDIRDRLHEFIWTKLLAGEDPINLKDTTPLVSGGIIDSLSSLQVGLFIEKTFGVRIAPEELANPEHMETIAALTTLVRSKLPSSRCDA